MTKFFNFNKQVKSTKLQVDILSSGLESVYEHVYRIGSDVRIAMSDSITPAQEATLSGVVDAHDNIPLPKSPATSGVSVHAINGISGLISIENEDDTIDIVSTQENAEIARIKIKSRIPSASGALIEQNTQDIVEVSGLTGGVFGQGSQKAESESESSTTSSDFQQKLRMTTASLPSGTYHIGWYFEEKSNDESNPFESFRVQLDDGVDLALHGGVMGAHNEEQFHPNAGFKCEVLGSGVHTIDIDFKGNDMETVSIRSARLEIWRIS